MYGGTHLVDVQTSVDLLSGNSIAATAAARDERTTYRCAKKSTETAAEGTVKSFLGRSDGRRRSTYYTRRLSSGEQIRIESSAK